MTALMSPPHKRKLQPHPVDLFVGRKMRMRRKLLGLTQREMAKKMRLTFQLVQKYETGATRISASRLYEISKLLDVSVSYFFEDSDRAALR